MATTERDLLDRLVNPEGMGGTAALLGASLTPGVSTAVDAASALNAIKNRDALGLGISALGLLPFISGTMIRTGGKAAGQGIRSLADIRGVRRVSPISRLPYGPLVEERFVVEASPLSKIDNELDFYIEETPLDETVARIFEELGDARDQALLAGNARWDDEGRALKSIAELVREEGFDENIFRIARGAFQADPSLRNFSKVEKNLLDAIEDRLPLSSPRREVDLNISIPPYGDELRRMQRLGQETPSLRDMVGSRGIRSLGQAVIEDFEKARPLKVKDILGFRATGTHGIRHDLALGGPAPEPLHLMRLPRSFFFKQ